MDLCCYIQLLDIFITHQMLLVLGDHNANGTIDLPVTDGIT